MTSLWSALNPHLLLEPDVPQVDVLEAEKGGKGLTLVDVGNVAREKKNKNTSAKK